MAAPDDEPDNGAGSSLRGINTQRPPSAILRPATHLAAAILADETCDAIDNDGDGEIDERLTRPCSSACDSGVQVCAMGEWMACTAQPCCDVTAGPGLPVTDICPAAETANVTLCLMPGTYSVPAACHVRGSLVGLGEPGAVVIDGDVTLTDRIDRIQGLTITGTLRSEEPLDLLQDRLLAGVRINGPGGGAPPWPPLHLIMNNEVHDGLYVGYPSFVHANEITPLLGLGDDYADRQIATENHIVGPGSIGVQVSDSVRAYLGANLIEGVDTGIQVPCYIRGAQIVANRVIAEATGVDACGSGGQGIALLRNEIDYGGEAGAFVRADALRIEGNQVVRAAGAPTAPVSRGISANVLTPDGCSPCGAAVRDNTLVGGTQGIRIDHQFRASPALLTGNIVVSQGGTGVEICARDACPASPAFSITALGNDVHGGPTPWTGTGDPTGLNGNISADPLFVDAAAGDFRPGPDSPCIDAGSPGLLSVDLAGGPRSLDGNQDGIAAPDMGAWEVEFTCHDEDGDGFGAPGDLGCPGGRVPDCDDNDSAAFPGAIDLPGNSTNESCDGSPAACDPNRPGGWRNHGQFVSCVSRAVRLLVAQGLIPGDDGDLLVRTAAQSGVGK